MTFVRKTFPVLIVSAIHLYLLKWVLDAFGFRSFAFGLLSNCLIVSWVALSGQFVTFVLGTRYYRIQPFEREGRLYQRVGTGFFQILVGRGPWTLLNPTLRFSGKVAQLGELEKEMRKAEGGHLVAFITVALTTAFAAAQGWWDAAGWLSLFNVPFNLYPVMLQRCNRARIEKILRRTGVRRPAGGSTETGRKA
ncbi:MAG: hypothetical protein AB9869_18065 [Verrucomicrobiia bacterium]